jgi:hydroxymethylpyrimidine/phosphomethylpyrimidine kinase
LALGYGLENSIERAKKFIYHAIEKAPNLGQGPGPLAHKKGGEYA